MIVIIPLDNNHLIDLAIAEDLQIEEKHEISHKIDIVDQTVKTINVEITFQDQAQTKVTTQIITDIVQTQIPEMDFIQTTVLNFPHIREIETVQTKGIDNIKITYHETIQTIDQTY